MDNEELAVLIQAGDIGKIIPLWEKVRLLALLEAVGTFDSGAGARFSTWYMVHLKGAFTAACGIRTQRDRLDPLAGASSLDAPIIQDDPDGGTLGDTIPDPRAELALRAVEEDDRRARLHAVLSAAIAGLPEEQRGAVRGRYWEGVPVDKRALGKALRALRHPDVSRSLGQFR